jgi:hypothetical protein
VSRVKTFINGGSLLPGDLNAIQDDYETSFAAWHPFIERCGRMTAGSATIGTWVLHHGGTSAQDVQLVGAAGFGPHARIFMVPPGINDAAAAGARTPKYHVTASLLHNSGVVPATGTFTVGCYPVATCTADAVSTLGAVIAGSTIAFGTPAAGVPTRQASAEFALTTNQAYVLAFTNSAALVAGGVVAIHAHLQWRYV